MTLKSKFLLLLKRVARIIAPGFVRKLTETRLKKWQLQNELAQYQHFEPYQVKQPAVTGHRRKVLHVIGNFWTGGSSQLVVDIVERLGDLYEQEVVTRDIPSTPAYVGLKLHVVSTDEEIASSIDKFNPHLVHVHYLGHQRDDYGRQDFAWYGRFFRVAEDKNIPVVENINILTPPFESSVVRKYVYVSRLVQTRFAKAGNPNIVVHPGSDFTHFQPREKISRQNCIGMVYRLEKDKLNEQSIDVFIETLKQCKTAKALIVGGGTLLDFYKQRVDEEGLRNRFEFTGYVSYNKLPALYQKMDVFVAPVHRESFGQVTPFAMSTGLPVVAYNVDALSEILANDALLAAPGDSKKLSALVVDLLNEPERRLFIGNENQKRAHELFSVEKMISSYKNIYVEALLEQPVSPLS